MFVGWGYNYLFDCGVECMVESEVEVEVVRVSSCLGLTVLGVGDRNLHNNMNSISRQWKGEHSLSHRAGLYH